MERAFISAPKSFCAVQPWREGIGPRACMQIAPRGKCLTLQIPNAACNLTLKPDGGAKLAGDFAAVTYPPIYVLRHGETEWNAEGRFQGALNSPLTELGRAQAAQQAQILSQLDLQAFDIRVSPQGRAFETAAIALARQVARLETDARLREIGVGEWSGKLREGLSVQGATLTDTPDGPLALYEHAPGGEGFAALRARCEDFLASLTQPTICVTHGITSRMLRATAMQHPTASLGELPGGQGVVYCVENGQHRKL